MVGFHKKEHCCYIQQIRGWAISFFLSKHNLSTKKASEITRLQTALLCKRGLVISNALVNDIISEQELKEEGCFYAQKYQESLVDLIFPIDSLIRLRKHSCD